MSIVDGNYWYVIMAGAENFAADDENCEKLRHAMEHRVAVVEVIDAIGATTIVNPTYIVSINESTPATRDASYTWNKACDEQAADRRKRLGKFTEIE